MVPTFSGRIVERESGIGVQGLLVEAYGPGINGRPDLSPVVTDEKGTFRLPLETDASNPKNRDVTLNVAIFAPSRQLLLDKEISIRLPVDANRPIEIPLPRKALRDRAPSQPDHTVTDRIDLPKAALRIDQRGSFSIPRLPGFITSGSPGTPAVPRQIRYVALPLGATIVSLSIDPGECVVVPADHPVPAQRAVPVGSTRVAGGSVADLPDYRMTPLDVRFREQAGRYPRTLAVIHGTRLLGPFRLVAIEVRPVQYDFESRSYLFHPRLEYTLRFDGGERHTPDDKQIEYRGGELAYEHVLSFLENENVALAKGIEWDRKRWKTLEKTPHLIITDNYDWPEFVIDEQGGVARRRPPTLADRGAQIEGDMVAEFQRLAEWRTRLGIRSQVVSISDIVGGAYGPLIANVRARDLQEVVRNFIQHARARWGTLYVLMGASGDIVPMRKLTGSGTNIAGNERGSNNPPDDQRCYVSPALNVCKLRTHEHTTPDTPLSTYRTGTRIHHRDTPEAERAGYWWYYTSYEDFLGREEGFTPQSTPSEFVIVEGPAAIIDDDYYWLVDMTWMPSDFYYGSLVGSGYDGATHDFDVNGNELCGQYALDSAVGYEVSLDQVGPQWDVWVGRVPAHRGAEAKAFVDKVLAYESLCGLGPDGRPHLDRPIDPSYLRKVLYAAAYWGDPPEQHPTHDVTPGPGEFHQEVGSSRLHLSFDVETSQGLPQRILISRTDSPAGRSEIMVPYRSEGNHADVNTPGWFFVVDDLYDVPTAESTRFVKVVGPEEVVAPDVFVWDPVGRDGMAKDKERLRLQMSGWFPEFWNVTRHYADHFEVPSPPPVFALEESSIRNAINAGQHFVSLTSHGSGDGCCFINVNDDRYRTDQPEQNEYFQNRDRYFVAFAMSCSTAWPHKAEENRYSLGEVAVLREGAGAVAYVGYSRLAFVPPCDRYEEYFWRGLANLHGMSGHVLGPSAVARLAPEGIPAHWPLYGQILYGDPAMTVWGAVPARVITDHREADRRLHVEVRLELEDPKVPKVRPPVPRDMRVSLIGITAKKHVLVDSKRASSKGLVSFDLNGATDQFERLEITVCGRDVRPYWFTVRNGKG